jgi:oligopeptide transport system permease protein
MDDAARGQASADAQAAALVGEEAPDTYAALWSDALHDLSRNAVFVGAVLVILIMVAMAAVPHLFAGIFGHGDPRLCDLRFSGKGPASGHPFGYDIQGCDLYANVVYGARPSLTIGIASMSAITLLSIVLGLVSGFYGGFVDAVIARVSDVLFGFPFILGGIVILTSFPHRTVLTVTLVLVLFGWPSMTRVMRASVLATRNMDYVVSARGLGARDLRLLRKHILPNAVAPVLVLATLGVGALIVAEAGLTFLGVGLQLPSISWGLQLSGAQSYFNSEPHLLIFPALFLSLTVLSFVLAGDAIRDALDPKLR